MSSSARSDFWNELPCPCCGEKLELGVLAPTNVYLPMQLKMWPSSMGRMESAYPENATRINGRVVTGNI